MASEPCEACGRSVTIGGGIAAIWSFAPDKTGGMSLHFGDGTEAFLCFECLEDLPEDATAADVTSILDTDRRGSEE